MESSVDVCHHSLISETKMLRDIGSVSQGLQERQTQLHFSLVRAGLLPDWPGVRTITGSVPDSIRCLMISKMKNE